MADQAPVAPPSTPVSAGTERSGADPRPSVHLAVATAAPVSGVLTARVENLTGIPVGQRPTVNGHVKDRDLSVILGAFRTAVPMRLRLSKLSRLLVV